MSFVCRRNSVKHLRRMLNIVEKENIVVSTSVTGFIKQFTLRKYSVHRRFSFEPLKYDLQKNYKRSIHEDVKMTMFNRQFPVPSLQLYVKDTTRHTWYFNEKFPNFSQFHHHSHTEFFFLQINVTLRVNIDVAKSLESTQCYHWRKFIRLLLLLHIPGGFVILWSRACNVIYYFVAGLEFNLL